MAGRQLIATLRNAWGLWVAVALGLVGYVGLVRLDSVAKTLRDEFTPQTIGWYLVAFSGFLVALWWNERRPVSMLWMWTIPIVFRLLLLATTPTLSDDVYRYLWDGHVASNGINPYRYTLDAPELDAIAIPARDLANNPGLGTPYLPTAQLVFWATAVVAPATPLALQVVMVGFDLATAAVIVALLRTASLPTHRVMVYLWNPLVILEIAHGAHLESLMVFLAMLAVYLTFVRPETQNSATAPFVLALATLTKPLPVLLFPVLWWRWRWPQRVLYPVVVGAALVPLGWAAGWGLTGERTGTGLFGSTRVYSDWVFNSGLYQWSERWLARIVADPTTVLRTIVGITMAGVLGFVWVRSRGRDITGALRLAALPVMAYVLLTPTLNPWYILLLVALLPFLGGDDQRHRWLQLAPWLYLSGALVLSYLSYLDPLHHAEIEWVRRVEWVPTLALLGGGFVARRRLPSRREAPPGQKPRPATLGQRGP